MEFIQQNIYMIAIAVISGTLLLAMSFRRPSGRNSLTPTQATMLINREDAQVIDVRETEEYVAGHVPESRHFPLSRLEERAGELDKYKNTPLIVICQTGARSGKACQQLEKLGFTKVHSLDGGANGWQEAGLPLKKGAKK